MGVATKRRGLGCGNVYRVHPRRHGDDGRLIVDHSPHRENKKVLHIGGEHHQPGVTDAKALVQHKHDLKVGRVAGRRPRRKRVCRADQIAYAVGLHAAALRVRKVVHEGCLVGKAVWPARAGAGAPRRRGTVFRPDGRLVGRRHERQVLAQLVNVGGVLPVVDELVGPVPR